MSVIVKNMEMPTTCYDCKFREPFIDSAYCNLAEMDMEYEESYNCRHPDCPLIEIPTPHGRLIDIDDAIESYGERAELGYVSQSKFLNVVIQAEGSKDE